MRRRGRTRGHWREVGREDANLEPDDSPCYPAEDSFPGTFVQAQPTTQGRAYPQIQFETDLADTENGCDLGTGAGCTVPPPSTGR